MRILGRFVTGTVDALDTVRRESHVGPAVGPDASVGIDTPGDRARSHVGGGHPDPHALRAPRPGTRPTVRPPLAKRGGGSAPPALGSAVSAGRPRARPRSAAASSVLDKRLVPFQLVFPSGRKLERH